MSQTYLSICSLLVVLRLAHNAKPCPTRSWLVQQLCKEREVEPYTKACVF